MLLFYWLDAFELPYHQPGTAYLFGKVWHERAATYVRYTVHSPLPTCILLPFPQLLCCSEEYSQMSVLPTKREGTFQRSHTPALPISCSPSPIPQALTAAGRETDTPVSFEELYSEFNAKYAEPHRIMKFTSRRVNCKYAFDQSDVPQESEYLQVKYSAEYDAPPTNASGKTFSRVFGTTTSRYLSGSLWPLAMLVTFPPPPPLSLCSLEQLIVTCQLKGPCWLHIAQPSE